MEETYPLNEKKVVIFGEDVTLRELPAKYIIDVEKGNLQDTLFGSCLAGSNAEKELLDKLGSSQLEAMYSDIMVLSYGEDWKEQAEKENTSKKK